MSRVLIERGLLAPCLSLLDSAVCVKYKSSTDHNIYPNIHHIPPHTLSPSVSGERMADVARLAHEYAASGCEVGSKLATTRLVT